MLKRCKWCENEIIFDKIQSFASHVANCDKNPNLKDRLEKLSKLHKGVEIVKRYEVIKKCEKCFIKFVIKGSEKYLNSKKCKKFCSYKCANSHVKTEEQKQKISEINKTSVNVLTANKKAGIEKRGKKIRSTKNEIIGERKKYNFICELCNKEGINTRYRKNQRYHKECYLTISGGIRKGSSRGKSGWIVVTN